MPGASASGWTGGKADGSGMDSYTGFQTVTNPKRAVVVGGGFIGLEMVENLVHRGLEVTLIEKLNQVMPPLDPEMARLVERYLVNTACSSNSMTAWPDSSSPRMVRWKSSRVQARPSGGHRDPRDRRASGDGAGEDGRDRNRPARRYPRR